jgi:hypothetical protein
MKIKLDSIEALAKAHGSLGTHFKKASDHHTEMSKAYGEHAAFLKGKHDAMADDDMHKAAFGKMADHCETMSKLHKDAASHHAAMAEEHGEDKATADTMGKAADGSPVIAKSEPINIGDFLNKSTVEVMAELGKTDEFKGLIRDAVLKSVKEALGQVVPPLTTKAVGTVGDPTVTGSQLIARPGEKLPTLEKSDGPAELPHFFGNN